MTVCQQPTADYDIQKQSISFIPSLPQPLISFSPEAATLLASTVPLDKGGKGSKDEISRLPI